MFKSAWCKIKSGYASARFRVKSFVWDAFKEQGTNQKPFKTSKRVDPHSYKAHKSAKI